MIGPGLSTPSPRPRGGLLLPGPRPRRAPSPAKPGPRWGILGPWARSFTNASWFAMLSIVCAHLVFGAEDVPVLARILLATPAVLCIGEVAAYLKSESRELPFVVVWLAQYYLAFGFEVFFDLPFFDLSGPVNFTAATRIEGAMASALGALSFWATARVVMRAGKNLPRLARPLLPPDVPLEGWDAAFYAYTALTLLIFYGFLAAPGAFPAQLMLVFIIVFAIPFALGLATARPPRALGQKAAQGLLLIGMLLGMFTGQIEPIGRTVVSYVSARLAVTRRLAVSILVVMGFLFLVLQPAKAKYREQVWGYAARTGSQVDLAGRVDAWNNAISDFFTETTHKKKDTPAVSRLTELGSVMHALMIVPTRVDYAYGKTLVQVLYAPIPRFIWKDKPDSRQEFGQQYAVIFGRQQENNIDSTAIGLCVLVEGYWNFGWLGIVLVGVAMGLYIGVHQRLFSADHWALLAAGIAQIYTVTGTVPVASTYGSLFQLAVGRLLAIWGVYRLALLFGKKRRGAARPPIGLARGGARR
jgi:hypothetical protein